MPQSNMARLSLPPPSQGHLPASATLHLGPISSPEFSNCILSASEASGTELILYQAHRTAHGCGLLSPSDSLKAEMLRKDGCLCYLTSVNT